jgi:hypothetical protein
METTLKTATVVPWTSPDGTIYPLGKPKGKAKMVKFYVPQWELADVMAAARKSGYDTMGPYFQESERKYRHIKRIQQAAARRLYQEMIAYGLDWKDIEAMK